MPLVHEVKVIPEVPEKALTPITPRPGQRPDGAFKNSVVDVRKRSTDTLLAYAEGSHWEITYYRQLLTKDMEPTSFQVLQDVPYQQYEKINRYPLRVTDPLSSSQNDETLLFTVTGGGILTIAIIPNVGDVFYADIGDGRYGLFSIERITRKTILKDSVYEVDYTLLDYQTKVNESLLESRVVRELFYSEDHLGAGRGPLITSKELESYRNIAHITNELFFYHLHKFLDKNNTTLLRSDSDGVYDPYFSLFWDKILPKEELNFYDIPRLIEVGDEYKNYKTIWDYILNKSLIDNQIEIEVEILPSYTRHVELIYNGISLTGIKNVISVKEGCIKPEPFLLKNLEPYEITKLKDFNEINKEGFYVLSEYFYLNRLERISKLELLVLNYLNAKPLNLDIYFDLLRKVKKLPDLEQFYFIPIMTCLAIDYLRNVS